MAVPAAAFVEKHKDDPEKWIFGMTYLGMAKTFEPDKRVAKSLLESVMARKDAQTPLAMAMQCQAAYWRAWIAEQDNDTETLRACAVRIPRRHDLQPLQGNRSQEVFESA